MKTFMLLLVIGVAIANCEDESGAIYFNGGRPTQIAFPTGYQNVKWMENKFTIHASLIINNRSGKVVRLDIINKGISDSSESPNLEKIIPRWQIVFASLVFESVKKWEFSKRTRLDTEPLDEIGFPLGLCFQKIDRAWQKSKSLKV